MPRRRVAWAAMVVVLGVSLVAGARAASSRPPSLDQRVRAITVQVRCPECEGQSVADSNAPASKAIREDVRQRLLSGQSKAEILAYLVSRFGEGILLKPRSTGIAGLVWALPVAAVICGLAGLAVAFRRWRARSPRKPTDDDRVLVERARHARPSGSGLGIGP